MLPVLKIEMIRYIESGSCCNAIYLSQEKINCCRVLLEYATKEINHSLLTIPFAQLITRCQTYYFCLKYFWKYKFIDYPKSILIFPSLDKKNRTFLIKNESYPALKNINKQISYRKTVQIIRKNSNFYNMQNQSDYYFVS